jgi:hypothetical protein
LSDYEDFLVRAKGEKRKDDLQEKLTSINSGVFDLGNKDDMIIGVLDDLFKELKELSDISRAKIKNGETFFSKFTIPSISSGNARFIYFDLVKGDAAGGSLNIKQLTTKEINYPYMKCFSIDLRNDGPAPIQFKINPKGPGDNRLSGELNPSEIRTFSSDTAVYHGVNIAIDKSDTVNSAEVEVFCET